MKNETIIVGQRLRSLRESLKYSQVKTAELVGVKQSSINRYESGEAQPPFEILIKYADLFDVSMDYIFGRTDRPQGKLYKYQPKFKMADPETEKFVEMCFEPGSPMYERLKQTLMKMLTEQAYEE